MIRKFEFRSRMNFTTFLGSDFYYVPFCKQLTIRESVPEKCQQKSKATEALFHSRKFPTASNVFHVFDVFVNREKLAMRKEKRSGK